MKFSKENIIPVVAFVGGTVVGAVGTTALLIHIGHVIGLRDAVMDRTAEWFVDEKIFGKKLVDRPRSVTYNQYTNRPGGTYPTHSNEDAKESI